MNMTTSKRDLLARIHDIERDIDIYMHDVLRYEKNITLVYEKMMFHWAQVHEVLTLLYPDDDLYRNGGMNLVILQTGLDESRDMRLCYKAYRKQASRYAKLLSRQRRNIEELLIPMEEWMRCSEEYNEGNKDVDPLDYSRPAMVRTAFMRYRHLISILDKFGSLPNE